MNLLYLVYVVNSSYAIHKKSEMKKNQGRMDFLYDAKFIDGELKLYAIMSLMNSQKAMTVEEVVADIWKCYIQVYL